MFTIRSTKIRATAHRISRLDPFYRKQSRSIGLLHRKSIELTAGLFTLRTVNESYDPEIGMGKIKEFADLVRSQSGVLGVDRIARILRRRSQHGGFTHKSELERDISRSEVLQLNIEEEIGLLWKRKLLACSIALMLIALVDYTVLAFLVWKAVGS